MEQTTRIWAAGVDVRIDETIPDDSWTDARRELFLLRPDIARPLSADRWVWRTISHPSAPTDDLPLPWIDADDVRARIALWPEPTRRDATLVAIGVLSVDARDEANLQDAMGVYEPLAIDPSWSFIGYDVVERGIGVSGLCNCGYNADELDSLRREWSARLNDSGLFGDPGDALQFRAMTDRRVAEHAPFVVAGLWRVG